MEKWESIGFGINLFPKGNSRILRHRKHNLVLPFLFFCQTFYQIHGLTVVKNTTKGLESIIVPLRFWRSIVNLYVT